MTPVFIIVAVLGQVVGVSEPLPDLNTCSIGADYYRRLVAETPELTVDGRLVQREDVWVYCEERAEPPAIERAVGEEG